MAQGIKYEPCSYEQIEIIDASGILGWLGRKRKEAIIKANSIVLKKQSNKISVLDIGCGYGEILSDIAGGLKVGVDVNTEAIKRAKQRAKSAFFILCDIEKLPFKPKTFVFVICSEVLEHLDDPSMLVNQIVETTKYGGFFCLTVPNEWVLTLGRFFLQIKPYRSPAHKKVYNWRKLKGLFPHAVVKRKNIPFGFLPFLLSTNLLVLFRR